MLSEMEAAPVWDAEFEKKWSSRLLSLSADERLTMWALDAIAYNNALAGVTDDPEQLRRHRLRIRIWHSLFRNILTFNWTNFKPDSRLALSMAQEEGRRMVQPAVEGEAKG
jgi:hypothetical protein